ncbi:hypothetical protein [Capnocytophaga felis]|uniref:Uncharacterized protein n=1 Tax=Capnocytophaga felis TaxID=2267611 RepID=A0A5M4BA38_9FLAO|nr:hypothetical protein [Capnocytophaga felis]GET46461.1 hypothetical protein RCZ01_17630 [Capnocytophaga felis]GET48351.1 hypothetical protein RCZ02_11820 [Capnocytophaga felis]
MNRLSKLLSIFALTIFFVNCSGSSNNDENQNPNQNAPKPIATNTDGWKVETISVNSQAGYVDIEVEITYPQPVAGSNTPPNDNYYSALYEVKTTDGTLYWKDYYLGYKPEEGKSIGHVSIEFPSTKVADLSTLTLKLKKSR